MRPVPPVRDEQRRLRTFIPHRGTDTSDLCALGFWIPPPSNDPIFGKVGKMIGRSLTNDLITAQFGGVGMGEAHRATDTQIKFTGTYAFD